jgi:very-short-patch-repair endonuclease/predicted transcriptional regulator of viral defense system
MEAPRHELSPPNRFAAPAAAPAPTSAPASAPTSAPASAPASSPASAPAFAPTRVPARAAAVERAILQVAARQHGVVTRSQLVDAGLSLSSIDRRLAAGRLTGLHRGVYRVGPPVAPRTREMAAVLACGGATVLARGHAAAEVRGVAAALSHGSATELLRLFPDRRGRGPMEVSVAGSCRRHAGIHVHRVRALPADEVTWVEGIPVTTPARTILDMAPSLATRELERVVAEAIALRGTTPDGLLRLARSLRHARRPGVHRVRALLGADSDPARTRSVAEERFLELVRKTDVPDPETDFRIGRYTVDFVWPNQRVVVEIDGFTYHSSPASLEADHRRDSDLDAAGFHVLRFTWRKIQKEPMKVVGRVCRAIGRAEGRAEGRTERHAVRRRRTELSREAGTADQ